MRNKRGLFARIVSVFIPASAGAWLLVVAYITMALFVVTMSFIIYRIRTIPIPPMVDDSGAGVWPTPTNAVQENISGKLSANSNGWAPSALLLAKWTNAPVAEMTDEEMVEELEGVYRWTIETTTNRVDWVTLDDSFTGRDKDTDAEQRWWAELLNMNKTDGLRIFRAKHP